MFKKLFWGRYVYEVSNRLSEPHSDVKLTITIEAESRKQSVQIAAEFGFKHGLLLTGPM